MMRAMTITAHLPFLALAQTFTPLFDGTSLAGWTVQGQGTWEVREGIIQGTGKTSNPKNTWLISEKSAYKDFDFRFKFMGVTGNSGLNFRSTQGTEDVTGMQVEVTLNGTRVVNHTLARGEAQGFFAFQLHDKAVTRISLKDIEVAEAGGVSIRMLRVRHGEPRSLSLFPEASAFDLAGRRLPRVPVAEGLSPEPRAGGPYFRAP